jgi:hypothetical protein
MTMATLNNLAIVRYRMGRLDAAEAAFAITICVRKLGARDLRTAESRAARGVTLGRCDAGGKRIHCWW